MVNDQKPSDLKRKRKLPIVVAIMVALLAIVALYAGRRPEGQQGSTPSLKTVTINQAFEHLLYIGLYVAQDAGFFAKQGLDVRIETGGGDAQAFSALTSGSAQFAQGDPAFVAIAAEKGWDGRVIAMAVDRVAIWGVTYDSTIQPFTDPSGFKGHTVATYPEPNTSYVVQKQLGLKGGLKLGRDTGILQVPFGTELAALSGKQADIAQTIEPNVSQVELQGAHVVFDYSAAWGPLAFTGLMTSEALIKQDPILVQKVVTAYEQSLQYIQTNPQAVLKIAQERFPTLPPDVIKTALARLVSSGCIPKHARVDPESWRKLLQIRVDVGDLHSMPTKDLIDNSFAPDATK
jgi:NitT/TauT family transport system substrate-binding protein